MKKEYRYGLEYPHYYFEVIGAGDIEISESSEVTCGGEEGFSLGVSWGEHGFAGGVLPKKEALKLAEHILNTINKKELRKRKLKEIGRNEKL
jgi:hypothetical protein